MTESSREETKYRETENCREEKQHTEQTEFKLPKNIRQMGNPGQKYKFYIEDYAYTYLHTFLKERHMEDTLQAAVLLGTRQVYDGCEYTFVSKAAICDFSVFYEGGEAQAQKIIGENFPGEQIAGWYVRCSGQDSHVKSIIKHYYAQKGHASHLAFIYEDELEGEFSVFVWEQNGLRSLDGYYIYYERNPLMQEFLIRQKNGQVSSDNIRPRGEPIRKYQTEIEKKETEGLPEEEPENGSKKRPQKAVYAACAAVLIIAAATGIAQMGNYQGLKNFQKTIQTISGNFLNHEQEDTIKQQNNSSKEEASDSGAEQNDIEKEQESETGEIQEETIKENDTEKQEAEESEEKQIEQTENEQKDTEKKQEDTTEKDSAKAETLSQKSLDQGYYIVQKGDSLLSISRKLYQTDAMVDEICAVNGIKNLDVIYEGQKLKLP